MAVVGDGANSAGGGAANARQCLQLFDTVGENTIEFAANNLCGFMQIAGAGVVAEPCPLVQYLVEWRGGQCINIGVSATHALEVGNDGADLSLLQHDF